MFTAGWYALGLFSWPLWTFLQDARPGTPVEWGVWALFILLVVDGPLALVAILAGRGCP